MRPRVWRLRPADTGAFSAFLACGILARVGEWADAIALGALLVFFVVFGRVVRRFGADTTDD